MYPRILFTQQCIVIDDLYRIDDNSFGGLLTADQEKRLGKLMKKYSIHSYSFCCPFRTCSSQLAFENDTNETTPESYITRKCSETISRKREGEDLLVIPYNPYSTKNVDSIRISFESAQSGGGLK